MERKFLKGKIGLKYKKKRLGFTGLVGKCGCLLSTCPYCILDDFKKREDDEFNTHSIL